MKLVQTRSIRAFGAFLAVLVAASSHCESPPDQDDPALLALLSARTVADSLISQGDHVEAAHALVQSLRDCPPDRVALADAAYGNGQLASFLFLHVMQESAAYDYLLNRMDPEKYITDKMLKVLCYIAIGLNDEQKTEFSREASYLSSSDNLIVRAITRFYLSNPYFYSSEFTNQYAEALGEEFPDLELTQVALNFSLYNKSQVGGIPDLAAEIESKSAQSPRFKPWSTNMRTHIRQSAVAFAKKGEVTREVALTPLIDAIENSTDWHERHFTLLLIKDEFDGPLAARMRDVARSLSAREDNTPDVLQARALLATSLSADLAANVGDRVALEEVVGIANTLLKAGVGVTTPERVLWETWAYSVRGCADNLARVGYNEEANILYKALASKLPGSKIADAALASIREKNPQQTNDVQ